jgi:exocyst complex component 2
VPKLVVTSQKALHFQNHLFIFQSAQLAYHKLDDKLFDAYVEEKANPIIGVFEPNMYAGKFDWKNCSKPRG